MDLGIALAFLAMLFWAVAEYITKLALGKAPIGKVIAIREIIGLVFILIPAILLDELRWGPWSVIGIVIVISLLNAGAMYSWFHAMHHRGVSLTSPIINSWALVTVPLAFIFYSERLTGLQLIAGGMIVAGVILLLLKNTRDIRIDGKLWFALLAMVLWGVIFFLLKIPTESMGPFTVIVGIRLITGAFFLPSLGEKISKGAWELVTGMAIVDTLGFLFYLYSTQYTKISIAAPIVAAAPLVAVFLGVSLLKESLTQRQVTGAFITIAGAILISI